MEKRNNKIRLNEQEFKTLIEESVKRIIKEGKYGKIGDWLAAGALGGALAAGGVGSLAQKPQITKDKTEITAPVNRNDDEKVTQWMVDHNIEDTPENREAVWSQMFESKMNNKINKIIREEIMKVI